MSPRQSHQSLPVEIYVSTVDALYSDARSLAAGSISASLAALVTAWKAGEWTLLACAVVLALIGLARGADMRSYARQVRKPASIEAARYWEVRYIVGSAAYVAVLGAWCFLAFARTSDAAVHLISFSVILAYLVGVTGRNFSSDQLVTAQTVCAASPMIAGLLIQADVYYGFLAVLLVPFFLSLRFISARLRNILFDAVIATHEIGSLADRFDTALNNMPHGLCMFDANQRFAVANRRFHELLDLPAAADLAGMSVAELFGKCVPDEVPAREATAFEARMRRGKRNTVAAETEGGQTLELTFQPMQNGGCVVLVEDITERRNAEARIEQLARYDALTGLPNRTFFRDQFDAILAGGAESGARAIHFIDLDQFKQVNDTLGHPCGDALLCAVADRLRRAVRKSELVARFGGDEFVVLQPLQRGNEDASLLASRIVNALGEPYEIDGHQIVIGASVGISLMPQDGTTVDQLLKNADIALYRAKSDGRGIWRFFESDMDIKAQARRAIELDIRDALGRNEFQVHFQPIVDLKTGRTSSCEALLRWTHPERGRISPADFIPVAEETGLIVEIGNWVLRQACLECAQWPEEVRVAVNLSSIQFRRGNVSAAIRQALKASGLSADRLEVEITESVLLQDTPATRKALHQLRDLGVRISLDDFGTGYSSLSYLRSFPLQKIKIDRSFLSGVEVDPRSMTLLRGVARLSAELGMSVVVEGVETHQQLDLLAAEQSIAEVQGFLFSAAVPGHDIRTRLASERKDLVKVA